MIVTILRTADVLGVTSLAANSSGFTCHVLHLQQSLMVNGFAPPACKIVSQCGVKNTQETIFCCFYIHQCRMRRKLVRVTHYKE